MTDDGSAERAMYKRIWALVRPPTDPVARLLTGVVLCVFGMALVPAVQYGGWWVAVAAGLFLAILLSHLAARRYEERRGAGSQSR